jgi:trehalose/maltose hydrolase-like predicted phosphorylase
LFRIAARLDLDDLTGTTAEGLHLATMGGVWQALAFGFMGLRALRGTLAVNHCLPDSWRALGLTFRFGGNQVGVRAEPDCVTISCHEPILVQVADQAPTWCQSGTTIMTNPSTTQQGRP